MIEDSAEHLVDSDLYGTQPNMLYLPLATKMLTLVDLIAAIVAFFVGVFVRRHFIYTTGERKTNMPFIKEFDYIFGSKNIIFCNDKIMAELAEERHAELGDTFGCFFGPQMQAFCRDPELIYKVCVTDFQSFRNRKNNAESLSPFFVASLLEARDDKWQRSRRAIGSVLKASKLKLDNVGLDIDLTTSRMMVSIDRRLAELRAKNEDTVLDIYQINKNFFLQSILKILYNTETLVDFDSDQNEVVEELYAFINVNFERTARICFLIPQLTYLVRPFLEYLPQGKYISSLIQKLERILGTQMRDESEATHRTTVHSLIQSFKRGELSRQQLMGNAFFLMLAGFATSVDSMSAFMWELAHNQKVQDKLRADLISYGEDSKFMEQCLNETLRKYPGALTNRDICEDVLHNNFRLIKGTCFNINIFSVHRNPKYWSQPEVWDPERFAPEKVAKFHPAQFIPFGIGPRNCVGYHLAKMELTKFAVSFLLKYKLEACEATRPLKFTPLGALPFAVPIKPPVMLKVRPL